MEKLSMANGGRWRILVWGVIAAVIALPAVAMQFTDDVNWTALDFIFAAVLLGAAGLLLELAMHFRKPMHRALMAAGIILVVLTIWAEGAVGIFH